MRKLLILIAIIASPFIASCSQDPIVGRLPFVYRIDIQQGNVISQDEVNQLKPGMSRRQVIYLLGTPMLEDPFHTDRWDYIYLYEPGSKGGKAEHTRLTVFFEDEKLARLQGDLAPEPMADSEAPHHSAAVTVPPQKPEDTGILTRLWRWITFGFQD